MKALDRWQSCLKSDVEYPNFPESHKPIDPQPVEIHNPCECGGSWRRWEVHCTEKIIVHYRHEEM